MVTAPELRALLTSYGLPSPPGEIETTGPRAWITDRALFAALGVAVLETLDVSDYEGATIIQDLTAPLPEALFGRFDFILNGSCLDNLHDPAAALRNISRMLAIDGRVLHMEHGSNFNGPWMIFSPGWFVDYYEANGFEDLRAWAGMFLDMDTLYRGPWRLFEYTGGRWAHLPEQGPVKAQGVARVPQFMSLALARRTTMSTVEHAPTQWMYRPGVDRHDKREAWRDCGWFGAPAGWRGKAPVTSSR